MALLLLITLQFMALPQSLKPLSHTTVKFFNPFYWTPFERITKGSD
jgi:hypothetical protein